MSKKRTAFFFIIRKTSLMKARKLKSYRSYVNAKTPFAVMSIAYQPDQLQALFDQSGIVEGRIYEPAEK